MDPILEEIYSTVLGSARYVIAAYSLLWVGLMGYLFFALRRLRGVEREIKVLEESLERRS